MSDETVPSGYEEELSSYQPVLFNQSCGEPVAWGFLILRRLGEQRFEELRQHGSLECIAVGKWCLVKKWLTVAEALEKYGPVTIVELGPRGGFKSVTYGSKRFTQRRLDPRKAPIE